MLYFQQTVFGVQGQALNHLYAAFLSAEWMRLKVTDYPYETREQRKYRSQCCQRLQHKRQKTIAHSNTRFMAEFTTGWLRYGYSFGLPGHR